MHPSRALVLVLPAALGLAACNPGPAQPAQETHIILQQPQTPVAPTAPPPPQAELVPPPPVSPVPTVWQPGHWRYTGLSGQPWSWQPGRYIQMPPSAHTWVPGEWVAQNGEFMWQEGHWG